MINNRYQNEVLILALKTAISEWEKLSLIVSEPNLKIYIREAMSILEDAELRQAEYYRTQEEQERARLIRAGIDPDCPF